MGLAGTLGKLLFLVGVFGLCTGFEEEGCRNFRLQFERVFSVPGDVAMLNSTLVCPSVFNLSAVPYNVTWHRLNSAEPIRNVSGRFLVRGETLWFLNVTLADDGEYVTIVRTPLQCYRQETKLIVNQSNPAECGRPMKAGQSLTRMVTDRLSCPLKDYIHKLDSYGISSSITWYKGCDLISDTTKRFSYWGTRLKIEEVESDDEGLYTCTLEFTLGGVNGSVSETIDAEVKGDYFLVPQVREPANDTVKAPVGSNFTKRCLVFVPCVGMPSVDVFWLARGGFIDDPSKRIYTTETVKEWQDGGMLMEHWLIISELKEEDFYLNYTCRAFSARGNPNCYFTLLPTDPNVLLPVGLLLSSMMLLFIASISIYSFFKVDLVLWFRRTFPFLYTNTDSDGRLYDAYVAYPQKCVSGLREEVEVFALQTLPEVLEKACGYKLFIAGRDCLPGEAVVDSLEENLQASRRILLLYTSSSFSQKHCSNNNNTLLSPPGDHTRGQESVNQSELQSGPQSEAQCCEDVCPHSRMHLECMAAMHRALLEGSLKVILVELEEMGPSETEKLPESVRHLRQTQGAVCWWKTQRSRRKWRTNCIKRTEDTETGQDLTLTSCLSPNSMFWKEIRYQMPVRGKRAVYPDTTTLLKL